MNTVCAIQSFREKAISSKSKLYIISHDEVKMLMCPVETKILEKALSIQFRREISHTNVLNVKQVFGNNFIISVI